MAGLCKSKRSQGKASCWGWIGRRGLEDRLPWRLEDVRGRSGRMGESKQRTCKTTAGLALNRMSKWEPRNLTHPQSGCPRIFQVGTSRETRQCPHWAWPSGCNGAHAQWFLVGRDMFAYTLPQWTSSHHIKKPISSNCELNWEKADGIYYVSLTLKHHLL